MKKFTKIFAFAMALMMVFALQVPVSAAEKGAVIEAGVEAPEATVMTDVTKDYFALSSYPYNNTASFKVGCSTKMYQVFSLDYIIIKVNRLHIKM